MTCKNCGTRVRDNAKICPNCGAMLDENEGYVLLTSDGMDYEDYYSSDKKRKKKGGSGIRWFLSILLTLAIIGGGAYYYFDNIYQKETPQPNLTFETGSGLINGDEAIIYVTVKDGQNIEFIHGVKLYSYDTSKIEDGVPAVTSEYQYTKSINDTFRAIFFDIKDFELQKSNTYTFEMQFSFSGSSEVYTYTATVTFPDTIENDISDIIFDHSVEGVSTTDESNTQTDESTTKAEETTANTDDKNADFIYDSYWYTKPVTDGSDLTIYAYKFSKDGTYTATRYFKSGAKDWEVTSSSGKFEVSDYSVTVKGSAAGTEEYLIDFDSKTLEDMTARKYNSVQNAEDFFGI